MFLKSVLLPVVATLLAGLFIPRAASADTFDDHTVYWLKRATADAKPLESLDKKAGMALKPISKRIDATCLVVKTNEDNWTRALVIWAQRRQGDVMTPVLLIERFVTCRGDRPTLTTANGKEIILFPGFAFSFDIGQVVPEGQGGDLLFDADETLKPIGEAKLFGLDGPATPPPEPAKYPDPESHSGVLPTDFAGTWHVRIDGRWTGRWEIDVDERRLFGRFLSDETESVYEVHGKVSAIPHNAKFSVELTNADQAFDAYLWTKDKSAMAGTVVMASRKLGFFATRVKADASTKVD